MKTLKVSLALAATCAALALSWRQARAETRLELWPLLNVSGEYTDNLLFSPARAKHDELNTGVGGASLALTDQQRHLQLDFLTDWQLYAEHSEFDRALKDYYVGITDEEHFSDRTSLSLSDSFIKGQPIFGQALIGSSGVSTQLGQALLQKDFLTNSLYARLHQDLGATYSADLSGHQSFFSSNGATSGDSYSQGDGFTLFDRLSPQWKGLFGYDFEDFRFSARPRSEAHQPFLGFQYFPNQRMYLTAQTGPLIFQSASEVSADVGYSIAARYSREFVQFALTSSRQPSITAGFAGAGVSQNFGGAMVYAVGRRSNLSITSNYTRLSRGGADSEILTEGASIDYRLTRAVSVIGQYLWFRTTSPQAPPALTNTFSVSIRLTAEPWRWVL